MKKTCPLLFQRTCSSNTSRFLLSIKVEIILVAHLQERYFDLTADRYLCQSNLQERNHTRLSLTSANVIYRCILCYLCHSAPPGMQFTVNC